MSIIAKESFWFSLTAEEALAKLDTSASGLSAVEAARRLKDIGRNELPKNPPNPAWKIFLSQLLNPLVYVLLFAAFFTAVIGDFVDFAIIISAVILNSVIGFFQEYKADRTLTALRGTVKLTAKIIRDGRAVILPAEEVVPGDIMILEEGERVIADGRLLQYHELATDEKILTGESLPQSKHNDVLAEEVPVSGRMNMIFSGTSVLRGRGIVVVTATGVKTEFGKIFYALASIKEERSPLVRQIYKLSRAMAIIFSVVAAGAFFIGIAEGNPLVETLITMIAMAVAAIPEGLPAAVSIVLALGMQRVYRERGLIRKMGAAETLGAVSVIATDKTGTLTYGRLSLEKIFGLSEKDVSNALKIGILANDASYGADKKILGDPIDVAILEHAVKHSGAREAAAAESRIDELPFQSERRYMASLNQTGGRHHIYVKGAIEVILDRSNISKDRLEVIWDEYNAYAAKGYRVLAVAQKEHHSEKLAHEDINNLEFKGLLFFRDPLRPDARHVIDTCREAGIRPILITGDSVETASAIGKELGLDTLVFSGKELDKMSDDEVQSALFEANIFARILPLQKLRIIELLQKTGAIVAMTGDGVNDAPALKKADIGVALGSGTEVAKEASDLVITDDNLKTLLLAIREGRVIFQNIRKVILYLLAGSFKEIVLIFGAIIMRLPLPLLAGQILWINLVEDSLPALSLAFERGGKNLMKMPPRPPKESILNNELRFLIFATIIVTNTGLFVFYWLMVRAEFDLSYARTITFAAIGVGSLFYIYACRHLESSVWTKDFFGNKFLNLAVLFGFLMVGVAIYVPFFRDILRLAILGWRELVFLLAFGFANLFFLEILKFLRKIYIRSRVTRN